MNDGGEDEDIIHERNYNKLFKGNGVELIMELQNLW